jgi:hypothetical protein
MAANPRSAAYTHAQWRIQAENITTALGEVLAPALDHMHAGLVKADAGQTQRRYSARFPAEVRQLAAQGQQILGDHDERLTRVGQAQRQAGGVDEVAGDKAYNTRRG